MADRIPVLECITLTVSEECAADPIQFREILEIADRMKQQGMTGQFWGPTTEKRNRFVWFLLKTLADDAMESLCFHFRKHLPLKVLNAPTTEIDIYTIKEGHTRGEVERTWSAVARSIEGTEGHVATSWGDVRQSEGQPGQGIWICGWESVEAHMNQGGTNEEFRRTGEDAVTLVANLEAAHAKLQAY
ncbi:hypothetical protein EW146_g8109 [Bondarzewia mesenterica]|uniref:ABM domain-containing protein n=1 Tax=Bondarzewia mesenterica TaxID=1095465 RepID=A0A4S4LMK5_9AGAM|nr:hypothetical protein EW146_g8109 [Bondarzewia mesenterica]